MYSATCLCKSNDELGESPLWIEEENSIYWVDIKKSLIHKLNIKELKKQTWSFEEQIGCIAHSHDTRFVAGTQNGFCFIDLDNNKITPIINPEKHLSNNRFNDGKCDNIGRFYSGTMNEIDSTPSGSFYILYNDLSCKKIDGTYVTTNGPTFSPDYKYIYFTDTREGKIFFSALDKEGLPIEKKLFISIPSNRGKPDGMTIDENGSLWVALFGGSRVDCYNFDGKKINEIQLPVSCVTSCTFGGKNLDTLFITTSSFKLNNEQKIKEPLAGSLFCIELGVKGIQSPKFHYNKQF